MKKSPIFCTLTIAHHNNKFFEIFGYRVQLIILCEPLFLAEGRLFATTPAKWCFLVVVILLSGSWLLSFNARFVESPLLSCFCLLLFCDFRRMEGWVCIFPLLLVEKKELPNVNNELRNLFGPIISPRRQNFIMARENSMSWGSIWFFRREVNFSRASWALWAKDSPRN